MKKDQTNGSKHNFNKCCLHVSSHLNETIQPKCVPYMQPGRMPLNAGDTGYGTVPGAGLSASVGASESAPLLIPDSEPNQRYKWQPLTMDELEVAAGGPGWRKVRCYLVMLFWLAWVAMLAISIAIVATSPRPSVTPLRWWQKTLFYQLQPDLTMEKQAAAPEGINGEERPVSDFGLPPLKIIQYFHLQSMRS